MEDEMLLPEVPADLTGEARSPVPDLEPHYEPEMVCEGRCEMDPIPGGKRFQGTWLVLDEGTRYVLSYRPVPAYFPFVDKRVWVTGRPYTPGRDTQHMLAMHFQVQSIELAPGEVPHAGSPTELPAPPLLRTSAELVARCGRWGQVVGTLAKLEDDSETSFCTAILHLEDGTQLHALYAARHMWAPFLGRTVTVVSRIEPDAAAGETGVVLTGWYAICSGVVCRCGM